MGMKYFYLFLRASDKYKKLNSHKICFIYWKLLYGKVVNFGVKVLTFSYWDIFIMCLKQVNKSVLITGNSLSSRNSQKVWYCGTKFCIYTFWTLTNVLQKESDGFVKINNEQGVMLL